MRTLATLLRARRSYRHTFPTNSLSQDLWLVVKLHQVLAADGDDLHHKRLRAGDVVTGAGYGCLVFFRHMDARMEPSCCWDSGTTCRVSGINLGRSWSRLGGLPKKKPGTGGQRLRYLGMSHPSIAQRRCSSSSC
jgi:hypothetical protein